MGEGGEGGGGGGGGGGKAGRAAEQIMKSKRSGINQRSAARCGVQARLSFKQSRRELSTRLRLMPPRARVPVYTPPEAGERPQGVAEPLLTPTEQEQACLYACQGTCLYTCLYACQNA